MYSDTKKPFLSLFFIFIILLLFVSSINIPYFNLSQNVEATGTSNWHTVPSAQIDNNTWGDLEDYFNALYIIGGKNFGYSGSDNSSTFYGEHYYYFFTSYHDDPTAGVNHSYDVRFDGKDITDDYVLSELQDGVDYYIRAYILYVNTTFTTNITINIYGSSWYCVQNTAADEVTGMMLEHTPFAGFEDANTYVGAWTVQDTDLNHLRNGSIIMSLNSLNTNEYTTYKSIAASFVDYCNITTNNTYFRGDIYLILRIDGTNFPTITDETSGSVDAKLNYYYTLSNGDIIACYYIRSITDYNYTGTETFTIKISTADAIDIVRPDKAADTGIWDLYSLWMDGGAYELWAFNAFLSTVRLFITDGANPLPDILCIIGGVTGGYDHTDNDGYTKFFTLTIGVSYRFNLYDQGNTHHSFDYTPTVPNLTIGYIFIVTPSIDYFVSLNSTGLQSAGLTHQRIRYYYMFDQLDTYYLTIFCVNSNTTIFNKTLLVNTGYLDYWFQINGTYFFNSTNRFTNAVHTSDMIIINTTNPSFYFYPQYSPFKCFDNQKFYYHNNLTSNITLNIEGNFYQIIPDKTAGNVSLSFSDSAVYNATLSVYNVTGILTRQTFGVYMLEYVANITITPQEFGGQQFTMQHNFIGEGNTFLRISTTPDFIQVLYSTEISFSSLNTALLYLQGADILYYVDIWVNNVQITLISTYGTTSGVDPFVTPTPVGITPLINLNEVFAGVGIDPTAGYYLVGLTIIIGFAMVFLALSMSASTGMLGAILGAIMGILIGFIPIWVAMLLGIMAAAMLVIGRWSESHTTAGGK